MFSSVPSAAVMKTALKSSDSRFWQELAHNSRFPNDFGVIAAGCAWQQNRFSALVNVSAQSRAALRLGSSLVPC